jgi:hypothetical protein
MNGRLISARERRGRVYYSASLVWNQLDARKFLGILTKMVDIANDIYV